jgi:cytidylate kinase
MLAQVMRLPFVDSGAMYRSVTLKAIREGADLTDPKALERVARRAKIKLSVMSRGKQKVYLDGRDVTKAIRTPELTEKVFYIAREPKVRHEMVRQQRLMAKRSGAVMEGRDIGTVVFPKADYKFFFTASDAIRARRRYRELKAAGKKVSIKEVLKDMLRRDRHDRTRKEGPLRKAKDAFTIDTTPLTIKATVDRILATIKAHPKGRR